MLPGYELEASVVAWALGAVFDAIATRAGLLVAFYPSLHTKMTAGAPRDANHLDDKASRLGLDIKGGEVDTMISPIWRRLSTCRLWSRSEAELRPLDLCGHRHSPFGPNKSWQPRSQIAWLHSRAK